MSRAKTQAPKGRNNSAQGSAFRDLQLRPLSSFLREPLRNGHSATASSDPNGIRTLTLTAVTVGDFSERNTKITSADAHRVKDLWLEPGDILIQRSNAPELVGTSRLYRGDRNYAIFPDLMIRVRLNDEADPRFIELVLQSEPLRQYFKGRAKGMSGSMPKIDQETIAEAPIPHFHIDDQRRIVAEIEKQFTRLEAGVAALRRVQANLKRYRAAVLKAAYEGRLVPTEAELARAEGRPFESGQQLLARILTERRQNWQGRGKYKEPESPDVENLVTLPDGWTWATVDQITVNHDGRRVPLKSADRDKRSGQYPYYGASGIIDDIDDFLFDGDFLLIAEDGANLLSRSTPIAFKATGRFWVNNHAHIVQTLGGMPLAYLAVFLNGKDLSFSVTGSAQPKLTQAALNKIPVPLPPLAEQTRIVAEVERRLSVVEELETVVTTNLQRATRLRQSILQKAFTGGMSSQ